MASMKNQIIENLEVTKSPHRLGERKKKDGKMKVYPQNILKIREIRIHFFIIRPEPENFKETSHLLLLSRQVVE